MAVTWTIILTMAGAYAITGLRRQYALAANQLDIPNSRSSHFRPTPSSGGIGIVVAFLGGLLGLYLSNDISSTTFGIYSIGGALVAGTGLIDDFRHLSASFRLIVHYTAFGLALYAQLHGTPFQLSPLSNWFMIIGIISLLVWILNLFNFMDGIDGIACGEAIFTLLSATAILFCLHGMNGQIFVAITLASACLGFLFWNWPPAKIFMGDVGSGFLGYVIGCLMLETTLTNIKFFWVWLILLGVFIVDATLTLIRRLANFEPFFKAHCNHAYQKSARKYGSHKKVTVWVLLINLLWLFPLAVGAALKPEAGPIVTTIAYFPLVILALWLGAGKKE